MLDYATQVSELEKIARLAPSPVVVRPLPALHPGLLPGEHACLVCGKRPARACALCGSVSYCGVGHQEADARFHNAVCNDLADIAEDANAPLGEVVSELQTRMAHGLDGLLGPDLTPERRRRLSDLATRPLTLATMVRALDRPARSSLVVHVMAAARREQEVPLPAWAVASQLLGVRLELALVGPELPQETSTLTHPDVAVRTRRALYRRSLWAELGQPDLVIGYDCGLMMYPTWKSTILELRGSGVPFAITTFRDWEVAAEARLLRAVGATCLLAPAKNPWASQMGKRSSTIANDVSFDNAYVSAWQ